MSESGGPSAESLTVADTRDNLRTVVFGNRLAPQGRGVFFDYRARQIMFSAHQWARAAGRLVTPEHLIVALVEQGSPDVVAACNTARVDLRQARDTAAAMLGWATQNIPSLRPLEPAGTADRPPLPISDLPEVLWTAAQERVARLPLSRIQRQWQWYRLSYKEQRAARRLADQHDLTIDQRYSFFHHYHASVDGLAANVVPQLLSPPMASGPIFRSEAGRRRRPKKTQIRILGGWACWFGNRKAGLREWSFRLTWRY